MLEKLGRIRLLYIVLGVLLLVGLLPLAFAGFLLSSRSADELRSIEGRYQAQLVQDKARQIELYGQRYRDVVTGLARAFEISGGIKALNDSGYDQRSDSAGNLDRKSTRLNSSHMSISYAVFCLKKKTDNLREPVAAGLR